jgi:enoyl-CoA hydratase/carnithine racemase
VIIAKKTVKQASNLGLNQGLEFEKDVFYSMLNTKAAKEGVTAFANKRKPDFKGL